jgi:hypothetical protein
MSNIENPLNEMIRVASQKVFNVFFIKLNNELQHKISLDSEGTLGEVYHNSYSKILIEKLLRNNKKVKKFKWVDAPRPSCELLIIDL